MFPIIRECRSAAAPITTAVTDDGTLLILPRYTQPEKDHQLLLQRCLSRPHQSAARTRISLTERQRHQRCSEGLLNA